MDAFGNTLEVEKRHQHAQKVLFCMRVLGVYFRKPPGPHFVRNRVRMTWHKLRLDCAGMSGSHMCNFLKNRPRETFLYDFDVVSGARRSDLADIWPKKPSSLRVSTRCSVGVMETAGNCQNSAQTQVRSEVKVYLSDKSYD